MAANNNAADDQNKTGGLILPDAESLVDKKKVNLGRGYSLMDWIRLTKQTPDIAGNQGILRRITPEELAQHNKEDDCWLAILDKVYNVTPYMKFHPGGVDELMRGAGINATKVFNDVHPWVNYQSMLEKCLIGFLVNPNSPAPSTSSSSSLKPAVNEKPKSKPFLEVQGSVEKPAAVPTPPPVFTKSTSVEIPVLDSYQSVETVTIVLYTKCKMLTQECLTIDRTSPAINDTTTTQSTIILYLYIANNVFRYDIEIPAPVQDDYNLKISKEGKLELVLHKIEKIHWWQMCPKLNFKADVADNVKSGVNYRPCVLKKRVQLTHDTDLYYLGLPESSRMIVPVGHHVFLRPCDDSESALLAKPYTAVVDYASMERRGDHHQDNESQKTVCLMIKHYDDGALTPLLKQVKLGGKIEMSVHTGSFQIQRLEECNELFLICAGTGLTPMIRLIKLGLQKDNILRLTLLFFNKTQKDIIWRSELDQLAEKHTKFSIVHVLSQPESDWKGLKGRISAQLMDELVGSKLNWPFFCLCGPKPFTDLTIELIKKLNYSENFICPFTG